MLDTEQLLKANFNHEIKKIQEMYDKQIQSFINVSKENSRLKDEHFKDEEMKRLKEENAKLRRQNPFPEVFMDKVNEHCKLCDIRYVYGTFEVDHTHIASYYKWTCPVCKTEVEEFW